MTVAPASTAAGRYSAATSSGVLAITRSHPANASFVSSSTSTSPPMNGIVCPTLRGEASSRNRPAGNFRASISDRMMDPTAPVAPTRATVLNFMAWSLSGGVGEHTAGRVRRANRSRGVSGLNNRSAAG